VLEGQLDVVEMGFKRCKVLGLQRGRQLVPLMVRVNSFDMAEESLHEDNADGSESSSLFVRYPTDKAG